ncbi:Protein CBG26332 [Caenorhabditis briggsae]|uniref:Protein CBG26332 n=1 Tax=Caenorhabditis briggsae TaxID=6238 RepID=B6IGA4_CAEBR|nr:Protein CBG26332 [Caenorhabditis briggsae]CAR98934.1 Protein CBG26332 [Caenorhabditis briggsae]
MKCILLSPLLAIWKHGGGGTQKAKRTQKSPHTKTISRQKEVSIKFSF